MIQIMADPKIVDYLQKNKDYPREEVRRKLREAGYPEEEIEAAEMYLAKTPKEERAAAASRGESLPSAAELLRQAWEAFKQRAGTLLPIAAVPAAVLSAFLGVMAIAAPEALRAMAASGRVEGAGALAAALFGGLSLVVSWAGYLALYLAIVNPQLTVTAAYRSALESRRFLSFAWVMVLEMAAIFGGLLLLIVPGIIAAVWFMFAPFVFVVENARGFDALRRSRAYVRGRWWAVAWRAFAALFTVVAVLFGAGIVIGILFGLITGGSSGGLVTDFVAESINIAVQWIVTPFGFLYLWILYREVSGKRRQDKDGAAASVGQRVSPEG